MMSVGAAEREVEVEEAWFWRGEEEGWLAGGMVWRRCERVFHASFLSVGGLSLWGMYAAMILSGASAVLRVMERNLPLMGLMSVIDGVMCGAVTMEMPVWDCGSLEVSALWMKV